MRRLRENRMLEGVYMCKTCVICDQSRIKEGDLGVVYVAKRSRYVSFMGETRMTRCKTLTLTLSLALIHFEWHERSLKRRVFVVFPCANDVILTFMLCK